MSEDIVQRLHELAIALHDYDRDMLFEAADEIERLRDAKRRVLKIADDLAKEVERQGGRLANALRLTARSKTEGLASWREA
jgi:hypothetical protein